MSHACHAKRPRAAENPVPHQSPPSAVSATSDLPRLKRMWMWPSATPATQRAAASTASAENPVRYQSPPSAVSATPATWNECGCERATPATWNEGGCCQVPRLSPSATPATQSEGGCHQVPRLPRKEPRAAASTASAENPVRHQSPLSALSATPATWNECGCEQVPHLLRETNVDVAKCLLKLWGVLVGLRFEPPCAHSSHTTTCCCEGLTQLYLHN